MRAHQSLMACGMVVGVIVSEVGAPGGPVNIEVALLGAIPDPVEERVNFLRPFLLDCVVCKPH